MKLFVLALFVAAAFAAPLDEEIGEPVELIVNGVAEGEALEIGDVLGIKVKQHVDGEIVSASDLLYPLTAAGLEDAAVADVPEPIEIVEQPENVEVIPEPVELPPPEIPEYSPVLVPDAIEIPMPPAPEVVPLPPAPEVVPLPPAPEDIPDLVEEEFPIENHPAPAPQFPNGEIFNDGVVQVTLNAPEVGVLSTVQSWFNMVLNYFNDEGQTTHQIV